MSSRAYRRLAGRHYTARCGNSEDRGEKATGNPDRLNKNCERCAENATVHCTNTIVQTLRTNTLMGLLQSLPDDTHLQSKPEPATAGPREARDSTSTFGFHHVMSLGSQRLHVPTIIIILAIVFLKRNKEIPLAETTTEIFVYFLKSDRK